MAIQSPDYFKLDGVSSEQYGLYVDTPPMPPMAVQKTSSNDFDLNHEDIVTRRDYFKNIDVTLKCYFFDIPNNINALYSWLLTGKKLETSRFDDFYYKIKAVKSIKVSYKGSDIYVLNITFTCSPYRYKLDSTISLVWEDSAIKNGVEISNAGSIPAFPIIDIYVTDENKLLMPEQNDAAVTEQYGNYFYVNNNKFGFLIFKTNLPLHIYVDCYNKITYDSNGKILLTFGAYPVLKQGKNKLETKGKYLGNTITIDTQERYI